MPINRQEIEQFSNLEIIAKQVVEGFITGLHKSPFHGFSVEFAEHRLYNTGESTKHIDWKLYGRSDKLFIKRYEEETNLRCQLIIDTSSSMYFPYIDKDQQGLNKARFSANCAAAIIMMLQKQRDAFGLSLFGEDVSTHTQAKSSSLHQKILFHELEKLYHTPDKETYLKSSIVNALHEIAEKTHKRSLVVIFSDMMESYKDHNELFLALQHLRHNKHEVILFLVKDQDKEENFNFENRPQLFIDLETGEEVKIHSNSIRESYKEQVLASKKDLILKCGQFKIDVVEADINLGYRQILFPYLLKREKI